MHPLTLLVLPDRLAVCRLPPDAPFPALPPDGFWSVTRTSEELSVILPEAAVPRETEWKIEPGWRILRVEGTLDFSLTGILASIAEPLAESGVPLFALSTYDTDYVLVRDADLDWAKSALAARGHEVR
ncbi:MAG TPA: ACT domain-containing protein [Thermoanaerobaculia bacterium]|nr:ACT domain-containing protein [Thermoanaerobaculia bacterium]